MGGGRSSQKSLSTVLQQKTGIFGLDEVLNGGLPKYTLTLLSGTSGTGKTLFGFQWLFNGIKQGENGIYISITESLSVAVRNIESMEFYDRKVIEEEKLRLFDIKENLDYEKIEPKLILQYIEKKIKDNNAKRLVIDSITGLLCAINDKVKMAEFMFELKAVLATLGCTTILISKVTSKKGYSVYGVEELVTDGVLALNNIIGENQNVRNLQVIKMRGIKYRTGAIIFEINSSGILLYPKIPINLNVATTEFSQRLSSGITKLDHLCDGGKWGFPQSHVIVISGNTGTGKSTCAMQFLKAGLENGENGIYMALEESSIQIKKTAFEHGWNFEEYEKMGQLIFINPGLIDINPDKILYEAVNAVNKIGASRLIIDSISSLESATMNKNKVREFLIQLSGFMKEKGVTVMLTYLSENTFNSNIGQLIAGGTASDLRLSSIVDGLILLRYVERAEKVLKFLNILKMRGVQHDKKIWEFEIIKGGINIGETLKP